jgi:hypothetical protein
MDRETPKRSTEGVEVDIGRYRLGYESKSQGGPNVGDGGVGIAVEAGADCGAFNADLCIHVQGQLKRCLRLTAFGERL